MAAGPSSSLPFFLQKNQFSEIESTVKKNKQIAVVRREKGYLPPAMTVTGIAN
jgi:hypothetical protein